jgi:hypothetical protein
LYFVIPASRNNALGRERDIPAAKADSSRQPSNKHATSLRIWKNAQNQGWRVRCNMLQEPAEQTPA